MVSPACSRLALADDAENLLRFPLAVGWHLVEHTKNAERQTVLELITDRSQSGTARGVEHGVDLLGAAAAVLADEAHKLGAVLVLALFDRLRRHDARVSALLVGTVVSGRSGGGGNGCVCHRTHPFLEILTKLSSLILIERTCFPLRGFDLGPLTPEAASGSIASATKKPGNAPSFRKSVKLISGGEPNLGDSRSVGTH